MTPPPRILLRNGQLQSKTGALAATKQRTTTKGKTNNTPTKDPYTYTEIGFTTDNPTTKILLHPATNTRYTATLTPLIEPENPYTYRIPKTHGST